MTFYRDLTPYEFGRTEPQPDILNIGWLSDDRSFAQAAPDRRFVDALQQLVVHPVNLYRGKHLCELCPAPSWKLSASGKPMPDLDSIASGNGEIRVVGTDRVTYVAPVLILHYVTEHHYAPPTQFVDAFLRAGSKS